MDMIEQLTPEQEAELPRFRQQYLDIACGGGRIDRDVLQSALNDAYAMIGKEPPTLLIFDSPTMAMAALKIVSLPITDLVGDQLQDQISAKLRIHLRGQLGDQLGDQLGHQLRGQLWGLMCDQLGDQLQEQLKDQIWDRLRDHMSDQLWNQLGDQLWDQLSDQLGNHLRFQLGNHVRSQLQEQLKDQIWDQLRDHMSDQLQNQLWNQLWVHLRKELDSQQIWNPNFLCGSQELYWIAWAEFAIHIGVTFPSNLTRRLDIIRRISTQCEWWWAYENMVIVSQRPLYVKFDDRQRLHCETGKSVEYADGTGISTWHGVSIPDNWVSERATIDPVEILKCANVEQRAAGIACVGMARAMDTLGYQVIDSDPDASHGELIEISGEKLGLPEPGRFLRAECPRNGYIVEGVPLEVKTVRQAQAWRVGLVEQDFEYPLIRT